MSDAIKKMTAERLVEKLEEWEQKVTHLEKRGVNRLFNDEYRKANNNYKRYLREWAKREKSPDSEFVLK